MKNMKKDTLTSIKTVSFKLVAKAIILKYLEPIIYVFARKTMFSVFQDLFDNETPYLPFYNPKIHPNTTNIGIIVCCLLEWPFALLLNTNLFVVLEVILRLFWYVLVGSCVTLYVILQALFSKLSIDTICDKIIEIQAKEALKKGKEI